MVVMVFDRDHFYCPPTDSRRTVVSDFLFRGEVPCAGTQPTSPPVQGPAPLDKTPTLDLPPSSTAPPHPDPQTCSV